MQQRWAWTLTVLGLVSSVAAAAESPLDAARRCGMVKDSLERLVCYDRLFGPDAMPPAARAPSATPMVPVAPPAPVAAPVAAAPVAAAPAAAPALGDEAVKKHSKATKSNEPTGLTANVSALKEIGQNLYRISLDNGQVWQQVESASLFQVAVGDTVRIEKGVMGSYRMSRTSNGQSGWVHVTRVE